MTNQMFLPDRCSIKAINCRVYIYVWYLIALIRQVLLNSLPPTSEEIPTCRRTTAVLCATLDLGCTHAGIISALLFHGKEQHKINWCMAKEIQEELFSIGFLGPKKHLFCPRIPENG